MTAPPAATTPGLGRARSAATQRTIDSVWAALVIGLPAIVVALSRLSTVDLAYGVRTGQLVLGGGGIPRVDAFTFTAAGLPWVDQQWLAHVVFGAAYGLGGWTALQVLWVGVVSATVALTARAAFVAGAGLRTSVLVALGGFVVAAQGFGLRAQALGLLCLAVLLILVSGRRKRPNAFWLAVPLLAVWANLHGSFAVGLALLAVAVVEDRGDGAALRRDLAVAVAASAATLANPYGIDAWRYLVSIGTDPTISRFVTEWRHTDPLQPAGAVFYASVVIVAILLAVAARRGRPPDFGSSLWLVALAFLGGWALRAVAWWGIGAVPAVAVAATATLPKRIATVEATSRPRHVLTGAMALLALLLAGGMCLVLPAGNRLTDAPAGMATTVRSLAASHPGLRVFNAERWGSWLELQVPAATYFADSRIELIPASAWRDYVAVSEAEPGWDGLLDRWQVDAVVLSISDQPALVGAIDRSAAWRVVHSDADGLVAVRA